MDVTSYLLGKKAGGGSKPPVLQDKEVTITENGTTNVTADDGYDGLNEVGVTTNVQPDLESKSVTITENTTTTITPTTGKDGLSEVEVTTSVPPSGLDEYFENIIQGGGSGGYQNDYPGWVKMVKKLPTPLTISGTNLDYAFYNFAGTTIPEIGSTSNVTSMISMFDSCKFITSVPSMNTSNVTDTRYMFRMCQNLTSFPNLDTSNVTNMTSMFEKAGYQKNNCVYPTYLDTSNVIYMESIFSVTNIVEVPQGFDTGKATSIANIFYDCTKLTTVPVLNASSINKNWGFQNAFYNCNSLTDTSIDNILQMCISATSYNGTKTLGQLGFWSNYYPVSRIQALPHYQDFIDAGWTIGY